MKLWFFLVTLLCLAVKFGSSDIGFGHSDEVDDESVPLQPVVPPPFKSNLNVEMVDTNAADVEPVLPSGIEHGHSVTGVENMESAAVGTDGVADSIVCEVSNTALEPVVDNQEDNARGEPIAQLADSVLQPTTVDAIDTNRTAHPQSISSSHEANAEVVPEPEVVLLVSEKVIKDEPKFDETVSDNGLASIEDELSMDASSTTEALLDQLDAAEAQIAALTANNSALAVSLATAMADAATANKEVNELRTQIATLTTSLATLNEELRTKANITSEQQEQLNGQHAAVLHAVNEKLAACDRNATTLAIKARLEKNEKNIARLSVENCQLTLESSRHVQLDEMQELEAQIVALKKQLTEGKCSTISAASSLSNNAQSVRKPPTSATTSSYPATPSGADCDASQCLDRLLSKYVFFWAPEHQSAKQLPPSPTSTATPASTSTLLPSVPTEETSASSGSTASGAQSVRKIERSDAHLDRVGDNDQAVDSGVLLAVQVLQRVGSSAASLYVQQVHPLVYTLLKSEFMVVAAVAKGAYEGVAWLWNAAISPVFFNTVLPTLQNVYYTQLMPFLQSTVYPWYRVNLEQTVNSTLDRANKHYIEHYEEWIGYYILDPCEFLLGRAYYLQYFFFKFVQSEDLGEQIEQIGMYVANFVPSVITQLCSIPALQSHFGDSCVLVVSSVVYGTVALGAYLCRRVVLGVIALVLMLLLSPLLLGVYLCAKVLAVLRPRKKTKRAPGSAARGSNSGNGNSGSKGVKSNNSTGRRESSNSSSQVSTKLPMNAAIASVAPGGHSVGGNPASQLPPPPTTSSAAGYSGQMYSSVSGAPPQVPYAYNNAASSGPPSRQTHHRSGSDESLNQRGAPPTSVTGETWLGV